jgi:adenine-specific DNA methylase
MARRAGGSVQNLVNSISQFDDIDTSFAAGGKINQILSQFGGSFDTLAAANASEEEVAEMLISSLKDIAGNFNQQMTDPKQRRAVLKDLQKEFKLPPEMIAGILNEQNSLSKDMLSIARTPSVTKVEAMPEEDKRAMALDLTKQQDVQRIQQENLFIGNMTFALEKFVANQKQEIISGSRAIGESIDKVMKEARTGNFAESFNLAGEAVKAYTSTMKTFTDDFVASLGSQGVLDQAGEKLKQNVDAIDSDRALKAAEQRINALHAANKTQEEAKINAYKSQIVEALKTQQPQIDLRGINVQVNFPGGGFKVYDRAGNLIAQG